MNKISLCVAKIGKNHYEITTTDMKNRLEAPYFQEWQECNWQARLKAMAGARASDPFQQHLAGLQAAARPAPVPSSWLGKLY